MSNTWQTPKHLIDIFASVVPTGRAQSKPPPIYWNPPYSSGIALRDMDEVRIVATSEIRRWSDEDRIAQELIGMVDRWEAVERLLACEPCAVDAVRRAWPRLHTEKNSFKLFLYLAQFSGSCDSLLNFKG